jgi:predicted nucleotidyltransferase
VALYLLSTPDAPLGGSNSSLKNAIVTVSQELRKDLEVEREKNAAYIEMLLEAQYLASADHYTLKEIASKVFNPLSVEERVLLACEANMTSSHMLGHALISMCNVLSEAMLHASREGATSDGEKM